jgi:hypothetical protein
MKTLALLLIGACPLPAAEAVPSAVSVTPSSGSGVSQVFTFIFTSSSGLYNMYMDIGTVGVGEPHTCMVRYAGDLGDNTILSLLNDGSDQEVGSVRMGTTQSVSNSQCTISGSGGMAVVSGNNITVPVAITFAAGYNGKKNIFGFAENNLSQNSGSQMLGTWTPSEPTLTAASVFPNLGGGEPNEIFTGSYSDSNGASDVQVVYLTFTTASTQPAANSCLVAYVPSNNQLYLFNDAATGVAAGSPITAGTSSTLQNSQCMLSGSAGTATLSGNNVSAPFNLTFQNPVIGIQQNIYGMVQRYDGAQSAWTLLGTWTP